MSDTAVSQPEVNKNGAAANAAALAAAAALACGVCCVLPFALPAAALAVAGGTIAWFAAIMPGAIIVAAIAVVFAWTWVVMQSVRSGKRAALSTIITLIAATLLLAAAVGWPMLEGSVVRFLRGGH